MNFSKAILLLAFVVVSIGAADGSSHAAAKGIGSSLFQEHHGDLRAPHQGIVTEENPCQSEQDVLFACLDSIGTGQSCWDCVAAIEQDFFDSGATLCVELLPIMCDGWNNACPCGSCEDEWEDYYWGCFQLTACGALVCPLVEVSETCESELACVNGCIVQMSQCIAQC